ncbi:hypothetical protein [Labedella endophytica]|uniref:Protein kinase domain-containing protein n=1 Tax=Labedella endophytica TaxID=1523160 RepID=A0A3S0VTC8_9MICO|nr:hypothetical protein [Labedella endophytica]RUR00777.1 hypothetical protein ELQ94_04245 [Labedella endophytica]
MTFDGDDGGARAMRLIERLEHLEGDCIPRVLDVCLDADGAPAVVLDFCGETLAAVVSAGVRLRGGELVTVLAPVLAALSSMHDRGLVHGAVSASSIAIGTGGRPLLLGCERATVASDSVDRRDRHRGAAGDLRSFADLVDDLAEAVSDPEARDRAARVADEIRAGAETPFAEGVRTAVEVRLFEIADPLPLAFDAGAEIDVGNSAGRAARSLGSPVVPRSRMRERSRSTPRRIVEGASSALSGGIGRSADLIRHRTEGWRSAEGGRRRRVLVAAGGAVVVAVVVATLIPTGDSSDADPASTEPAPTARASSAGAALSETANEPTDAPAEPTETAGPSNASSASPTDPDDAVAGTRGTLDALAGCSTGATDGCWETVFESGSRLLETVRRDGTGDLPRALGLPLDALTITQQQDLGDARLVALDPTDETEPASVLMIRTEAGWRIREVFGTAP